MVKNFRNTVLVQVQKVTEPTKAHDSGDQDLPRVMQGGSLPATKGSG